MVLAQCPVAETSIRFSQSLGTVLWRTAVVTQTTSKELMSLQANTWSHVMHFQSPFFPLSMDRCRKTHPQSQKLNNARCTFEPLEMSTLSFTCTLTTNNVEYSFGLRKRGCTYTFICSVVTTHKLIFALIINTYQPLWA